MASGDTLCVFGANNNEPPSTNPATLDTRAGASSASHLVLDFDAGTEESAEFGAIMPRHYAGTTGITVTIAWMASTATTGDVVWAVAFKSVSDDADDLDTKDFAAAQTVTATTSSLSGGGGVDYATIAFTDGAQMDNIAVGEYFRMRITRDADATPDDMAGDAELVAVEVRET